MEIAVIQARLHHETRPSLVRTNLSDVPKFPRDLNMSTSTEFMKSFSRLEGFRRNLTFSTDLPSTWNSSEIFFNQTNSSDYDFESQFFNATKTTDRPPWACTEWNPAQHSLFQTANFFFAAAFLVPGSFKQSVLLVRTLLSIGHCFITIWGGVEICALDILLWNSLIVFLNVTHTAILTWRFLPPTLSLEMTDLYLKVFKPLRVSKKHFKELIREGKVMQLEKGDIYAVEDVSSADERLSILLQGKLRVTCDDTHLHYINVYQFVDSPEWEANHDQSDDVFQVTITAEEDSVYLCWPRMKLERVLRHRPMLKVVLDSVIGKDITQKLYAINDHLTGLNDDINRSKRNAMWAKTQNRSMSLDAVNTGTTGLVRSQAYKKSQVQRINANASIFNDAGSLSKLHPHTFVPVVATQFPATSPFPMARNSPMGLLKQNLNIPKIPEVHGTPPVKNKSIRKNTTREVKFETHK
ncbi:blood vessel epicardial substance-A-like [Harmonia axyridis]|uniref:blood vessel epicardial substance-A-like n=1 Tax=Harmonia axyridis TaxID=115357 RepID=UPI001E2787A7|nr:blood vessel epicardial substance-A-like [Harmonia axyridis]